MTPFRLESVRPDAARLPVVFVNAYLAGEPGPPGEASGPWALVDTGLPHSAALTRAAARARSGDRPPATADERGVVSVPLPAPDPLRWRLALGVATLDRRAGLR